MKIKEIIVVEGQNDINKIQSCLEVDCLKTNGTYLSKSFLKQLQQLNLSRGIIVMTDDDYPGRWIRSQIQAALQHCKHAFIDKKYSRTATKVGIEHADCTAIKKALETVITLDNQQESLSFQDYLELGFVGPQASILRSRLLKKLQLPPMNGKRLFKTLNMMNLKKEEIERMCEDGKCKSI